MLQKTSVEEVRDDWFRPLPKCAEGSVIAALLFDCVNKAESPILYIEDFGHRLFQKRPFMADPT
jgi:hypothetical protein